MTGKRFEFREVHNGGITPRIWDNKKQKYSNLLESCNFLNELHEENEMRKEHQRTLESKIVRLKDRVKTFEKHYSLKDIERYKKMENCNCITSKELEE